MDGRFTYRPSPAVAEPAAAGTAISPLTSEEGIRSRVAPPAAPGGRNARDEAPGKVSAPKNRCEIGNTFRRSTAAASQASGGSLVQALPPEHEITPARPRRPRGRHHASTA